MDTFISFQNQHSALELSEALSEHCETIHILENWEEIFSQSITTPAVFITDRIETEQEERFPQLSPQLIFLLYTDIELSDYIHWFQSLNIKHLIHPIKEEPPTFANLIATIHKMDTQDIWGIKRYVESPLKIAHVLLSNSNERHSLKDTIEAYTAQHVTNPKFKQAVRIILEELIVNAFYSAPIDQNAHRMFDQQDRSIQVNLPAGKEIDVNYAYNGKYLLISVQDSYGSFHSSILINSLIRHFSDSIKLRKGEGGAGYGLLKIFKNATHLVVNLEQGKRTEFIVFIDISLRFREFLKQPSSINIFSI